MKTQWGSCNTVLRNIRLNTELVKKPKDLLEYVIVHELAHLREREHDKAFYQLCLNMEPDYHQLEFDVRLWLTAREFEAA